MFVNEKRIGKGGRFAEPTRQERYDGEEVVKNK